MGGGGGEAPQDAQEGHCGDGFQWKVIGGLLLVSSLSSTPTIPYDLNEYSKKNLCIIHLSKKQIGEKFIRFSIFLSYLNQSYKVHDNLQIAIVKQLRM